MSFFLSHEQYGYGTIFGMHTATARRSVIGLFFVNILVVCALWWLHSGELFLQGTSLGYTLSLGRLTGLLAQLALLVEIVLVARIHWIEEWYGNDKMVALHRWLGSSIMVFFMAHVILITVAYGIRSGTPFMAQLFAIVDMWADLRNATIGTLLFCVVGVTSVKIIRARMQYESWYLIHLLTYVSFFLVFGHQIQDGDVARGGALYYWLVLNGAVGLLFLGYRWMLPMINSRCHQFTIEKVVQEHPLIVSIYITGRHMHEFLFDGGQYATVRFRAPWFFYPHPFSFSTAYDGKSLRFTIKNLGSWTAAMGQLPPGTKVTLGGPYGRFTQKASTRNKFLLIAGGIGISPIVSLAQELARTYQRPGDVVALYSARTKAELALRADLVAATPRTVCFTSEPTDAIAVQSVIDKAAIERYVPDVLEREIYICGPLPMMQAVALMLQQCGVPKQHIHYEQFAY
jgi:predicted ferric reductase